MQLNSNKKYNISAIYCPPRYNWKNKDFNKLFKSLERGFIVGGDFNAKNILGIKINSKRKRITCSWRGKQM